MKLLIVLFLFLSVHVSGQFQKLHIEKIGKDKKIGSTYRIYVELKNEGDQLLVVFGDKDHTLNISSDQVFYQNQEGAATGNEAFSGKPKSVLEKDSWITISSDKENHPELQLMGMDCKDFEATGAGITSGKDGAWYILPTSKMSVCGADKRVLIAQLITKGKISGTLNLMGKSQKGDTWIEYDINLKN